MKHIHFILLYLFVVSGSNSQAQPTKNASAYPAKQEKKAVEFEMKTYYLVLLKKGPVRTQDSTTSAQIQEGHLKHLNKMYTAGKMNLAGPLLDDGDIRGICIYNVADLKEAKQLADEDPAIKSGRLIAEIHPLYSAKGAQLK